MPQAKDMSKFVVALVVACAITGLAALGTAWSGYQRMGLLFFGAFGGMYLLMYMLDHAAQEALGGPAPKKAGHKKR
jgi:hypothetical protein